MNIRRAVLLCGLLVLLTASRVWAVDPARRISQYAHSVWRSEDGFFGALPRATSQTADGYLWIATDNGLLRFDGVRFVPWTPPAGRQLPSSAIYALRAARDGGLWIGTQAGLSYWTGRDLVNYPDAETVAAIIEDRHGTVWVARGTRSNGDTSALCQVAGAGLRCHGPADGLPLQFGQSLAEDNRGGLWIGGSTGLVHGAPGSFVVDGPPGLVSDPSLGGVVGLAAIRDCAMWVGMSVSGPGLGLQQLVDGAWRPFVTPTFDGSAVQVLCLLMDREGALWVGTYHGLYRIHGNTVDHFGAADGLSSDLVMNVFEDREGNIWVATSGGLDCFRNVRVVTVSNRAGWSPGEVNSAFATRDGTVWVAALHDLAGVRQDHVTPIRTGRRLPGTTVTTMFEDHAGQLWVGIDRTLSIYEHGRFTPVNDRDGGRLGLIVGMTEDVEQNIWAEVAGTPRLLRIRGRTVQEAFPAPQMPAARKVAADPSGGIWLGLVTGDLARYRAGRLDVIPVERPRDSRIDQIAVQPDGSVLAAAAFGLIGWKNGQSHTMTARNGLPCDGVNAFVEDDRGGLWLYLQCALVEVPGAELRKWWQNPQAALNMRILDAADGVRPGLAPFQGAAKTPDGRLWFANGITLQVVDPARLEGNPVPPPVLVEELMADGIRYSPGPDLKIPPRVRDLQIDYTAMSFGAPQRVRFRYQLEGRDVGWQDPGTRRQAFYTDLRPARYRFRVKASNSDGVWNDKGATLDFTVLPAWYQTVWFSSLSVSFALGATWMLYRLRLYQLAAQFNRGLEARINERTRIARELHDTLLQSVHALLIHIQAATNLLPARPDDAKSRLESVIERTSLAIAEGRDAVQDLRSSAVFKNELAEAIGVLGDELVAAAANGQTAVRVHVEGTPRSLRPVVGDDVYRIAAEAVRNAVRHAGAQLIQVDIRYDDRQLRLCIRDDGQGIDPTTLAKRATPGHWGLPGMRERAALIGGQLEVRSRIGSGTQIDLNIPAAAVYVASARRRRFRIPRGTREGSS